MRGVSRRSTNFSDTSETRRLNKLTNTLNYNDGSIMTTDNARRVVSFNGNIGINQHTSEVNGLLDIDNLTQ